MGHGCTWHAAPEKPSWHWQLPMLQWPLPAHATPLTTKQSTFIVSTLERGAVPRSSSFAAFLACARPDRRVVGVEPQVDAREICPREHPSRSEDSVDVAGPPVQRGPHYGPRADRAHDLSAGSALGARKVDRRRRRRRGAAALTGGADRHHQRRRRYFEPPIEQLVARLFCSDQAHPNVTDTFSSQRLSEPPRMGTWYRTGGSGGVLKRRGVYSPALSACCSVLVCLPLLSPPLAVSVPSKITHEACMVADFSTDAEGHCELIMEELQAVLVQSIDEALWKIRFV